MFGFSPNRRWFLAVSHTGSLTLCDNIAGGGPRGILAKTPDGHWAAVSSGDSIRLWNTRERAFAATIWAGEPEVRAVAWTADGERLVCGHSDGALRVWNRRTGRSSGLGRHAAAVNDVAIDTVGGRVVSAGDDGVRVWSLERGGQLLLAGESEAPFRAVAVDPNGKWFVAGGACPVLLVADLGSGKERLPPTGHRNSVLAVAVNPVTSTVASADWKGAVKLWNDQTSSERNLAVANEPVHALAWSDDGTRLAAATSGRVLVFDVATGETTVEIAGAYGSIGGVCFGPGSDYLYSGSGHESVKMWNARSGELIRRLGTQPWMWGGDPDVPYKLRPRSPIARSYGLVAGVEATADGLRVLATGTRCIRVLDVLTGRELSRVDTEAKTPSNVVTSKDGRWIGVGGDPGQVWARDAPGEVSTFRVGSSVVLSDDGVWAYSIDDRSRTVRCWSLRSHSQQSWVELDSTPLSLAGRESVLWVGCGDGAIRRIEHRANR